jgi:uncharacterized protein (TIGR02147 family)
MRIFEFENYKEYVLARIAESPNRGRGQLKSIAETLRVHTTLISQIFNGSKDLTLEQAADLADFLGLGELESEYLVGMVELERGGTPRLKALCKKRLVRLARQAKKMAARFEDARKLSESDRAIFFSHWYYSAIHLLTDIPEFQSRDSIAKYLNLPAATVQNALDFLVSTGMVINDEGKLSCGPTWVFESSGSPYADRHHINWRLKAVERLHLHHEHEQYFTLPITISRKDREKILALIKDFVSKVKKTVEPSAPEKLSILTIDLFDPA